MNEILPAILAHDERTFVERLRLIEDLAPVVHIDVMDGKFVPNTTWHDINIIRELKTPIGFEFHLMIEDPATFISQALNLPNAQRFIWHVETGARHHELLAECHASTREAGLAISPKTEETIFDEYSVKELDEILIMGIKPGFSGQILIPSTLETAKRIHAKRPKTILGFDGGLNEKTLEMVRETGITRFCMASTIFETEDPRGTLKRLQNLHT